MMRFALVGKGAWGTNYIRTIRSLSWCSLPNENIRTRDYPQLFFRDDIHGVIIATPASTHYKIASEFLARGIPTLIEKPVAISSKDAEALRKLADKNHVVAMAGHIYLYNNAFIKVKRLLPHIGTIKYICSESSNLGRTDVSALWDWGPHDISQAIYLLDAPPVSVSAWRVGKRSNRKQHYDANLLHLTFPGGVRIFSYMSWTSPTKKKEMIIVGDKGMIMFNDISKRKITLINTLTTVKAVSYPSYSKCTPMEEELEEFARCIKRKAEPKTSLIKAQVVVDILEAAEKSIEANGKTIKL